jgi:hypothetical protein
MITGDQVLIAKEMSRILGLGMNISDATGLPSLDEDGKVGLRPLEQWSSGVGGSRLQRGTVGPVQQRRRR